MFSRRIKLAIVISLSASILSGCGGNGVISFKKPKEQKLQAESAIRVENGIIIYKETKKYDTSLIRSRGKNDYIFGN